MTHTNEKEYNWSFDRRNSQGEALFKHRTYETVDDVIDFLNTEFKWYNDRFYND